MAQVDPEDDSIPRIILYRYQFVPARRQHRHVVVAAFDHESEFDAFMADQQILLDEQKAGGLAEDVEYLHGVHKEAGEDWKQRNARNLFRHRVVPADLKDLPSSVSVSVHSCACEPEDDLPVETRDPVPRSLLDGPFEAIIWGWMIADAEVSKPTPGEMISGLPLRIGSVGPRSQRHMDPLTIQATVERMILDEWNHQIETVLDVDGIKFVHTEPAHGDLLMSAIGSTVELTGYVDSLPFYDLEDLRDLANLNDTDDLDLTENWLVVSVRSVPNDDSLIVELEPVRE